MSEKKQWEAIILFEGWPIEGEDLCERVRKCIETHPTLSFLTTAVFLGEPRKAPPLQPDFPMHASAPKGMKCADCSIDRRPCKGCWEAGCRSFEREVHEAHQGRIQELEAAIRKFLSAEGHDLCQENRQALWEALGEDGIVPVPTKVSREDFRRGCLKYEAETYDAPNLPELALRFRNVEDRMSFYAWLAEASKPFILTDTRTVEGPMDYSMFGVVPGLRFENQVPVPATGRRWWRCLSPDQRLYETITVDMLAREGRIDGDYFRFDVGWEQETKIGDDTFLPKDSAGRAPLNEVRIGGLRMRSSWRRPSSCPGFMDTPQAPGVCIHCGHPNGPNHGRNTQ